MFVFKNKAEFWGFICNINNIFLCQKAWVYISHAMC